MYSADIEPGLVIRLSEGITHDVSFIGSVCFIVENDCLVAERRDSVRLHMS